MDDFAKTLLYEDIPAYFTYNKATRKFVRRKRGTPVEGHRGVFKEHVLGRMYTVHIKNKECFYLRMLLHTVRGPTSFEALRTVNNEILPSYESACSALGLLHQDDHLDMTLEEAIVSQSPYKLRELFAVILLFCCPPREKALELWEKYKGEMSGDFLRQLVPPGGEAVPFFKSRSENLSLKHLNETTLLMDGKPITDFGLPAPIDVERVNMAYLRETTYDRQVLQDAVSLSEPLLTDEQKRAYEEILKSALEGPPQIYFLDAPGGTGKTFLINLLLSKVRLNEKIALAVASSGIAATLLPGGKTAHSLFKIPIDLEHLETSSTTIKKQSHEAKVLKEASLLIWDECTMANKKAVEIVDRTLRDLRDSNQLLGGMTVLFSGDFRQTLPVIPRGTRADEVDACLKRSSLWSHVRRLRLTRNMRVATGEGGDVESFSEKLLALGNGTEPADDCDNVQLNPDLCTLTDIEGLINSVYPDIGEIHSKPDSWLCERAILTPKNSEAAALNAKIQDLFQGEEVVYTAYNKTVEDEDSVNFPTEFLASVTAPGLPPQELKLKIGSPVMLLRNLKPPKLCNGTRLKVISLGRNIVEARILTGIGRGEDVFIPRIPIIPNNYPFTFRRVQFPLNLCFAMTINKSQGQTLKTAGLDLRSGCFSHGQLYVACSRVSSNSGLYVCANGNLTTNIVYKEVIEN